MSSYADKVPSSYGEIIGRQLNAHADQVNATIHLLDEGNTVPFLSRYRKKITGTLDDEQVRIIADELTRLRGLDERRTTILASIEEQGKLTIELRQAINVFATNLRALLSLPPLARMSRSGSMRGYPRRLS